MVFLHPFHQKNMQNASADVPKRRRESAHRRDEATLAHSFFVAEKTFKKNEKREKLKKGPGHGGIRRSPLRSRSKRGETQKTEIPQRQTKRKSVF